MIFGRSCREFQAMHPAPNFKRFAIREVADCLMFVFKRDESR